jgi:hypothetical protein
LVCIASGHIALMHFALAPITFAGVGAGSIWWGHDDVFDLGWHLVLLTQRRRWWFCHRVNGKEWERSVPLWIPLGVMLPPTAWVWLNDRRRRGACPRCRYDLTGNTTGVCPECGARIAHCGVRV